MRLPRALARVVGPARDGAGVLCARVQLSGFLGLGCALFRAGCVRVHVLAQGVIQRPHALESTDRGDAPLLDAAL